MADALQDAVIKQVDPFYAERPHLDFQFLRAAGLKHLGELSGKIWTDHNTHDPGITILESLCYALIDLGYRAELPIVDLLAKATETSNPTAAFSDDDNFFTPLEILSCNPTTISDYRKLLLEVKGVRNAWLVPVTKEDEEQKTASNEKNSQTQNAGSDEFDDSILYLAKGGSHLLCEKQEGSTPIYLNGLYSILIEKDPLATKDEIEADMREGEAEPGEDENQLTAKQKEEESPSGTDDAVFRAVRKILSAHRNLCEDFKDIVVLCPLEVGVCADVEIEKSADPEAVYRAVIEAVSSYIGPEIRYYTLKQLLDKGKAIEEIFAGRAFIVRSVGFVDTEELNDLSLRKELYASDLYHAILQIEGVHGIRHLTFQIDPVTAKGVGTIERLQVRDRYTAAFSLDRTCIQLRAGQTVLHIDKKRIHRGLAAGGKSKLARENLDTPIPQGRFDQELSNYPSVQYEFPIVYGIGRNGLPNEATPLRKVQALQLQGYLLFYDQLLADYLAQMASTRSLFSLRQESGRKLSERHTYFSQTLKEVPGIERLLQVNIARNLTDGTVLAVPVAKEDAFEQKLGELKDDPHGQLSVKDSCDQPEEAFPHYASATVTLREVSIRQSMRDLGQGDYSIEIYEDRGGYFFVIRFTEASESILVGKLRYRDSEAAHEAANIAAFLATSPDYYRKTSQKNRAGIVEYRFDVVTDAAADAAYLQFLLENESLYLERREAFLDHLLARFAVEFTDYSLVRFTAAEMEEQKRQLAVEDKSRFLSYFDELSRNRGRAYNYLKRSWGTHNVSGYEMRICLMAGMTDWARRSLCKFEVVPIYRIEMEKQDGGYWRSEQTYRSEEEVKQAAEELKAKLRNGENYDELESRLSDFKPSLARRIFSEVPGEENIDVSGYVYALQLKNSAGNVRQQSEQYYATEALAWKAVPEFLEEIKATGESALDLEETGKESGIYFDKRQMEYSIEAVASYRWYQLDEKGKRVTKSENTFPDIEAAMGDFLQNGDWKRFVAEEDGYHWQFTIAQCDVLMTGSVRYDSSASALKGLIEAIEIARLSKHYDLVGTTDKPDYHIELRNAGGRVLGTTPTLYSADQKVRRETLKNVRMASKRLHPPLKVSREPDRYRWCLRDLSGAKFEDICSETFTRKEEATRDFEAFMRRQADEGPQTDIAQQIYAIELYPNPARYRFIYCVNSAEGHPLPLLRSAQEFESRGEAQRAYTNFVDTLPTLQRTADTIEQGDQPIAMLTAGTEEKREKADLLLEYMHKQYAAGRERQGYSSSWIYRLVDKDHPVVRSNDSYPTKDAAQRDETNVCSFKPWPLECGKQVIRTICPKLDPKRFHHAICLPDDNGNEFTFLISYVGYETREAAQEAGESNWLRLIELAADRSQYGKQIALQETYPDKPGVCPEAEPYQAVLADEFRQEHGNVAEDKAVQLAKRYPIRIEYRRDKDGRPTREVKGYKFQGYDLASEKCVWQSKRLYVSPKEALNAYRIFVAVLGNRNSCRIVCDEGRYWIDLVEIMAESEEEFPAPDDAWGEKQATSTDACGEEVCIDSGVRLFADTAIAESAFIAQHKRDPQGKQDCYQFIVVGRDYHVARHTCAYSTEEERDKAIKEVQNWVQGLTASEYHRFIRDGLLYCDLGEGNFLESLERRFEWQDANIKEKVEEWFSLALGNGVYTEEEGERYLVEPGSSTKVARIGRENGVLSVTEFQNLVRKGAYRTDVKDGYLRYVIGDYFLESPRRSSEWREANVKEVVDRWFYLALRKANCQPEKNTNEGRLIDPFNNDAVVARIGRVQGNFDIEAFRELVREYPVFKRGDGYYFRLFYPANSGVLDEQVELFQCKSEEESTQISNMQSGEVKSSEEKSQRPPLFCGNPYIFESAQGYRCREAAENAFAHFLDLLKNSDTYHPDSESGIGPYSFGIIDPEKVLASHPYCHPDRGGAMRAAERARACLKDEGMHLLEHILLRPQTHDHETACKCLLPVSPDFDCALQWKDDPDAEDPCANTKNPPVEYIPGADPYSFWATVVLPGWSQRFQRRETRQFFKEMLYREVPAMVGLNILWLSPKQMCAFDEAFRKWLAWRCSPTQLCEDRDKALCELVKCLKSLRNDPLCQSAEKLSAECDCLPKVQEPPPACVERADQLFWWTGEENGESREEKNDTGAQPGIAAAPTGETEHAVETGKAVNPAAVRQTLARRKKTYTKNVDAVTEEKVRASEGYKQAEFFVTHAQDDLSGFKKLTAQILEKELQSARTEAVAAFASILQNATWYWLDQQVQANPMEVPADVRSFLTELFHTMKSKGMDITGMVKDWQSEDLRSVTHAACIEEYVRLLKET